MSEQSTIYAINAASQPGVLQVQKVWTEGANGGIAAGLTNLVQFPWADGALLLGQAPNGSLQAYKLTSSAPFVAPVATKFALSGPRDILRPFVIGGRQHLLAYRAQKGTLHFHAVNDDLTLSKPLEYHRQRSPGLTTGWTMLQPLTYLNMVYYVTYDFATGAVEMFNVNVTATSLDGIPPLQTLNVWSWMWAKGWKSFAFFQFGGENFFFKINVDKPNVNIDHLCLDPNLRSNEVCTGMNDDMPDNQDPNLVVRSFEMGDGAPYLVTYLPSGATKYFRVHADCQGWTNEAQVVGATGNSDIVTYRIGDQTFALFY